MGTIRDEISKNLLYYRKKNGLTQKELADKLGVKNSAVSNWEKGLNSIDIETLFEACKVFNISINDMYGEYSNEPAKPTKKIQEILKILNQLDDSDLEIIRAEASVLLKTEKYAVKSTKMA